MKDETFKCLNRIAIYLFLEICDATGSDGLGLVESLIDGEKQ